jgi:hypothetical protein
LPFRGGADGDGFDVPRRDASATVVVDRWLLHGLRELHRQNFRHAGHAVSEQLDDGTSLTIEVSPRC